MYEVCAISSRCVHRGRLKRALLVGLPFAVHPHTLSCAVRQRRAVFVHVGLDRRFVGESGRLPIIRCHTQVSQLPQLELHVHLLLRRLRQEGVARDDIGQAVFDTFFADMDQSMREAGVGDLGVGKKIRKMAQAFYGRAAAYDEAIGKQSPAAINEQTQKALGQVLARNLYPEAPELSPGIRAIASYLLQAESALAEKSLSDILAGNVFPKP